VDALSETNPLPRVSLARVEAALPAADKNASCQMDGCHQNLIETWPLFAGALALAAHAGARAATLDRLALAHLALSAAYAYVYAGLKVSPTHGLMRTGLFVIKTAVTYGTLGVAAAAARGNKDSLAEPIAGVAAFMVMLFSSFNLGQAAGNAAAKQA
jgi:uncharacterized MAPEG superfamily protein